MSAIDLYNRPSPDHAAKVARSIALLQRVAAEHPALTQASSLGAEDMAVTQLIHLAGIAAGHGLPLADEFGHIGRALMSVIGVDVFVIGVECAVQPVGAGVLPGLVPVGVEALLALVAVLIAG